MIKVCHITSVHKEEDVRIFHKECVSLANAGYETYLVERGESYDKSGVHIIGFGEVKGNRVVRMIKYARIAYEKALEINADVYHFHDPELMPYWLKLKKKGKVVIFDSHENTFDLIEQKTYIPELLRKPLGGFFRKYLLNACKNFDAIIFTDEADVFPNYEGNKAVITNYPIIGNNYSPPNYLSRKLIFAGTIHRGYNIHNVINAIDQIDGCRLMLFGSGSEKYIDDLKKLPGWEKVDYYGRVPYETVEEKMKDATIGLTLIQPNINTNWNHGAMGVIKLFEEMMAGLPVVCTNFDIWKPIISKYNCGICVRPDNVEEIKGAIEKIINNPTLAKQMGTNAKRASTEKYNWSSQEKILLDLYSELCKMINSKK